MSLRLILLILRISVFMLTGRMWTGTHKHRWIDVRTTTDIHRQVRTHIYMLTSWWSDRQTDRPISTVRQTSAFFLIRTSLRPVRLVGAVESWREPRTIKYSFYFVGDPSKHFIFRSFSTPGPFGQAVDIGNERTSVHLHAHKHARTSVRVHKHTHTQLHNWLAYLCTYVTTNTQPDTSAPTQTSPLRAFPQHTQTDPNLLDNLLNKL